MDNRYKNNYNSCDTQNGHWADFRPMEETIILSGVSIKKNRGGLYS